MIRVAVTGVAALPATAASAQVATADLATPPPGAMHVLSSRRTNSPPASPTSCSSRATRSTAIGDLRDTRVVTLDGKLLDADALRSVAGYAGRPK